MKHIRILTVFTFAALVLSACSQNGRLEDSKAGNDGGDGVVEGTVDGPGDEGQPSYPDLVRAKPVYENWASELKEVIKEVPHAVAPEIGQTENQNDLSEAVAVNAGKEVSSVERPKPVAAKDFPNISQPALTGDGPYVTNMEYAGYTEYPVGPGEAKIRITFSETVAPGFNYMDAYKVVVDGAEVSAFNAAVISYNSPCVHEVHFQINKGNYEFIVNASGLKDADGNVGVDSYKKSILIN